MTNAQIIANYCKAHNVTETMHTYAAWKKLGYQVRKGEKAAHKLTIWKYTEKKNEQDEVEDASMFMKTASFFLASQVDKAS